MAVLACFVVSCILCWLIGRFLFCKIRRLYYCGKSVFRGKYFHRHYIDQDGRLQIVYRTDFGLRFWTLMGRIYSYMVFVIPLFFLMVRLDGTNGYALAESDYNIGDTVFYYNVSEFRSEIGTYVSSGDTLIVENDAGNQIEISGFVIGKYYPEQLTWLSIPGLFVRSTVANIRVATTYILNTY